MKLKHMALLCTLTLFLTFASFTTAESKAKFLTPVATWVDPGGVYPTTYFFNFTSSSSCDVNLTPYPPYSVLWSGDVLINNGYVYADVTVIGWSGGPYPIYATIPITEH